MFLNEVIVVPLSMPDVMPSLACLSIECAVQRQAVSCWQTDRWRQIKTWGNSGHLSNMPNSGHTDIQLTLCSGFNLEILMAQDSPLHLELRNPQLLYWWSDLNHEKIMDTYHYMNLIHLSTKPPTTTSSITAVFCHYKKYDTLLHLWPFWTAYKWQHLLCTDFLH
jgi:hypothetical protein